MGNTTELTGRFAAIRARIRETLVEQALPSLSVAVARDGGILWEEGIGWADRERRVPATLHTMYALASITKPITATALMVLAERGLIDPARPANEYLGETKLRARVGDADGATVQRIANHTSGLPRHYQLFYEDEPYPRPQIEETIRRYGNLVTAPGERWRYSNLGYAVLGHIVSRVSSQGYADFVRREVFLPLGMLRSSVRVPRSCARTPQHSTDPMASPIPHTRRTPRAPRRRTRVSASSLASVCSTCEHAYRTRRPSSPTRPLRGCRSRRLTSAVRVGTASDGAPTTICTATGPSATRAIWAG